MTLEYVRISREPPCDCFHVCVLLLARLQATAKSSTRSEGTTDTGLGCSLQALRMRAASWLAYEGLGEPRGEHAPVVPAGYGQDQYP
jgi:hypothetical protein